MVDFENFECDEEEDDDDYVECIGCNWYDSEQHCCSAFECYGFECPTLPCEED